MDDLHPDEATGVPTAEPQHPLGAEASRRFDFKSWGRHRGPTARLGFKPGIGSLAAQTHLFNAVIGRSMASRRMIGQRLALPVAGAGRLPVRPPEEYFPVADDRRRFAVSPSEAERRNRSFAEIQARMSGVRRTAGKSPPLGLPRATSRASQSRVGRQTGPAGAAQRMASEPAYVANPGDVRGAGRLVSSRDRLTVEPRAASARPPPARPFTSNMAAPAATAVQRVGAADAELKKSPPTKAMAVGGPGPGTIFPSRPGDAGHPLPGQIGSGFGGARSSSTVLITGRSVPSSPPGARRVLAAGPSRGLGAGGSFYGRASPTPLIHEVLRRSALPRAPPPYDSRPFKRGFGPAGSTRASMTGPSSTLAQTGASATARARALAVSSAVHPASELLAPRTLPFFALAPLTPHIASAYAPGRPGWCIGIKVPWSRNRWFLA